MFIYKNKMEQLQDAKRDLTYMSTHVRVHPGLSWSGNGFFCASLSFKQNIFLDLLIHEKKTPAVFSAVSVLHALISSTTSSAPIN